MFQSQSEDIPTSDQLEIERMYFESIESDEVQTWQKNKMVILLIV